MRRCEGSRHDIFENLNLTNNNVECQGSWHHENNMDLANNNHLPGTSRPHEHHDPIPSPHDSRMNKMVPQFIIVPPNMTRLSITLKESILLFLGLLILFECSVLFTTIIHCNELFSHIPSDRIRYLLLG